MERMRLAASTASFANDFIMHCENNMDFAMETHEKWLLLVQYCQQHCPLHHACGDRVMHTTLLLACGKPESLSIHLRLWHKSSVCQWFSQFSPFS